MRNSTLERMAEERGHWSQKRRWSWYFSTNTSRADMWPRGRPYLLISEQPNLDPAEVTRKGNVGKRKVQSAQLCLRLCQFGNVVNLKEALNSSLPMVPWPRQGKAAIMLALKTFYWPLTVTGKGSDVSRIHLHRAWEAVVGLGEAVVGKHAHRKVTTFWSLSICLSPSCFKI